MNRYFEDFTAGQTFKHWPGRTITDFDNTWFTLMTMNTNPLHFDVAYAATTQHGRPLVNGLLVMATVVGMSVKDVSENAIANLEYESVRHTSPTFRRRHAVRRDDGARDDRVEVERRSRRHLR